MKRVVILLPVVLICAFAFVLAGREKPRTALSGPAREEALEPATQVVVEPLTSVVERVREPVASLHEESAPVPVAHVAEAPRAETAAAPAEEDDSTPGFIVRGRVLDANDSSPIAGADVAWRVGNKSLDERFTDVDGSFVIRSTQRLRGTITVSAAGYATARFGLASLSDDEFEVRMRGAASLAVTVHDEQGAPMEGVRVDLSFGFSFDAEREGVVGFDGREWSALTLVDGRCVIGDLPSGCDLSFELLRDGRILRPNRTVPPLLPGETREVEVPIEACVGFGGSLVDERGMPFVGVEVCVSYDRYAVERGSRDRSVIETTRTDAAGSFRFVCVPPMALVVGPLFEEDERLEREVVPQQVFVEPDAVVVRGVRSTELRIVVPRARFVVGRVLEPSGEPAGAGIRVGEPFGDSETLTEKDGSFRLALNPGPGSLGTFKLAATPPEGTGFSASESVEVVGGEDIVLHLLQGTSFRARVVGVDGQPANGEFSLMARGVWRGSFGEFEEGVLVAKGLMPGTYDLELRNGSEIAIVHGLVIDASSADRQHEFALTRAAVVHVRCTRDWITYRADQDGITLGIGRVGEDETQFFRAPAGRVVLHCVGASSRFERELVLTPGEVLVVELP